MSNPLPIAFLLLLAMLAFAFVWSEAPTISTPGPTAAGGGGGRRNTTDIAEGPRASSTANLTNTGLKCFNQKIGSKFVNQSMCKQGEFCVHVKCPIEKTDKAYKYYGNYLERRECSSDYDFCKFWILTADCNCKTCESNLCNSAMTIGSGGIVLLSALASFLASAFFPLVFFAFSGTKF